MLSLLLITALALQNPPVAKPTQDTTAAHHRRTTSAAPATPRGTSQSAVGRTAFHDRMRELWSDHVVYTREFIVSATAGQADTAEVLQRLLRNQDEIGEAVKPYYGDAAGTQLASLLRNHIQLAGKTLMVAKGTTTAMGNMNMKDSTSGQYSSNQYPSRMGDTVKANQQYPANPTTSGRMNDTTKAGRAYGTDTTKAKQSSQSPNATARKNQADTARANKQPNSRVTGDTMSQRLPSNQYGKTDSTAQNSQYAQGQTYQGQTQMNQTAQVDSNALNQAIAELKANGDSIADFLNKANPRGFPQETMRTAIQMHLTLLLKEATAQIKKDWSGSVAAFDESLRQATQMADVLSDGIIKQFPSRFTNKATTVSSR